jgi:LysM repeat protein
MAFFGGIRTGVLAVATLLVVNGCSPVDSGPTDEEKEPHFVLGDSRFNEMDWNGAIEAYEESLEVNPHSAQAHYRLAQLFDTKEPDPAAAIYHYEQYLKLEPDANNRDVIKQRIDSCKQQLATDVYALPSAPAVQKQLDSLVQQNKQLQSQVDQLNGVVKQWNVYYASEQAALKNGQPAAQNNSGAQTTSSTPDDISPLPAQQQSPPQPVARTTVTTPKSVLPRPQKARTHIVTGGETLASIARKHGVGLSALEAANPGLNPKKLHVGQSLNLPP